MNDANGPNLAGSLNISRRGLFRLGLVGSAGLALGGALLGLNLCEHWTSKATPSSQLSQIVLAQVMAPCRQPQSLGWRIRSMC